MFGSIQFRFIVRVSFLSRWMSEGTGLIYCSQCDENPIPLILYSSTDRSCYMLQFCPASGTRNEYLSLTSVNPRPRFSKRALFCSPLCWDSQTSLREKKTSRGVFEHGHRPCSNPQVLWLPVRVPPPPSLFHGFSHPPCLSDITFLVDSSKGKLGFTCLNCPSWPGYHSDMVMAFLMINGVALPADFSPDDISPGHSSMPHRPYSNSNYASSSSPESSSANISSHLCAADLSVKLPLFTPQLSNPFYFLEDGKLRQVPCVAQTATLIRRPT